MNKTNTKTHLADSYKTVDKTEGRGSNLNDAIAFFQFTQTIQPHYVPGFDSASNRNEYEESS
jgi:hypothetical protein